jgi:hypothetical protein
MPEEEALFFASHLNDVLSERRIDDKGLRKLAFAV